MTHIVYGIDEKYLPCLIVSMYSLLETVSGPVKVTIYVVGEKKKFEVISKVANHFSNVVVKIHRFSAEELVEYEMTETAKRFPVASMIPLFIPKLVDEKCLFIDADTLVLDDISKLYYTDLKGNLIGAVPHYQLSVYEKFASSSGYFDFFFQSKKVKINRSLERRANRLGFTVNELATEYFSTGVILFDIKAIRECGELDEMINLKEIQKFWSHFPDEEFLNNLFLNRVLFLHCKWNVPKDFPGIMRQYFPSQLKNEIQSAIIDPSILHFANLYLKKPWRKPWYSARKRYRTYKRVCQEINQKVGIDVNSMFDARQ